MKASFRKVARLTVASILVLVGICGLILPILNGTFFIILALILISLEFPALEVWLDKHSERSIVVHKIYKKAKVFMKKHF